MQEISPQVYIETAYAGVTLGAINWPHGLILIDSPFRMEDTRSWRSALLNLGGGVDRILVNLDGHMDRTLGARGMECTVVSQELLIDVFRSRPVNFKPQLNETGSEWEEINPLGSVRWAPPEISFSERMEIHWSSHPLVLEYHPGPASGASWAVLPDQSIVFVGDAVVVGQPPFLAYADLPAWIETLEQLASPTYQNFLIVGGRNGLVTHNQAREMLFQLRELHQRLEQMARRKAGPEDTAALLPEMIARYDSSGAKADQYHARLQHGLQQYFARRYRPAALEIDAD